GNTITTTTTTMTMTMTMTMTTTTIMIIIMTMTMIMTTTTIMIIIMTTIMIMTTTTIMTRGSTNCSAPLGYPARRACRSGRCWNRQRADLDEAEQIPMHAFGQRGPDRSQRQDAGTRLDSVRPPPRWRSCC